MTPPAHLRGRVLDLAAAPPPPIDVSRYVWVEIARLKVHLVEEDRVSGKRAYLVWGRPGSRNPSHRHRGDENVLVLQGAFRDDQGTYGPGDICRSRAGSSHYQEVVGAEDCICYVVDYGPLESSDD